MQPQTENEQQVAALVDRDSEPQTNETPDWLGFARELLGMCAGETLTAALTDSELLKLSDYLERLTHCAKEVGWKAGWEGGWRHGYTDALDFATDYLRLVEPPRNHERGN